MRRVDIMTIVKEFTGGIKFYGELTQPDFGFAEDIMSRGEKTAGFDVYDAYSVRVHNEFCGTYSVQVQRTDDYYRFINKMDMEKNEVYNIHRNIRNERREVTMDMVLRGEITYDQRDIWNDAIEAVYLDDLNNALEHDKKANFRVPEFEEWQANRYEKKGNAIKLTKAMSKAGFSTEFIDYYTASIRTEKELYLTITDRPQFIAGMSELSDGWRSCQSTSGGGELAQCLAGSLHDDKLFIAMLHESLEDLEDRNMEGKLIARTCMRWVEVEGSPILVATDYYGYNEGRGMLDKALKQLRPFGLFDRNVVTEYEPESQMMIEPANGDYYYDYEYEKEVEIYEEYEVTATCPMCEGSGHHTHETEDWEEYDVTCPCCEGDGELTFEKTVDEIVYITIYSSTTEFRTYDERYDHQGYQVEIWVDLEAVREAREEKLKMI
jgi:hypothetical protein